MAERTKRDEKYILNGLFLGRSHLMDKFVRVSLDDGDTDGSKRKPLLNEAKEMMNDMLEYKKQGVEGAGSAYEMMRVNVSHMESELGGVQ